MAIKQCQVFLFWAVKEGPGSPNTTFIQWRYPLLGIKACWKCILNADKLGLDIFNKPILFFNKAEIILII